MIEDDRAIEIRKYALPLVVAVTGHRDLVAAERDDITRLVEAFLSGLARDFPDRRIQVMSSVAEGADRIVARSALRLGLELIAPLPMEPREYRKDFETPESRAEFEDLCLQSSQLLVLPPDSPDRDQLYAQLGVFLSAHCHILLAIWDGKPGTALGGTGQVVRFHHDNVMDDIDVHITHRPAFCISPLLVGQHRDSCRFQSKYCICLDGVSCERIFPVDDIGRLHGDIDTGQPLKRSTGKVIVFDSGCMDSSHVSCHRYKRYRQCQANGQEL